MLCAYIHEPSFQYYPPAWGLRLCYHGIRFVAPGAQEGASLRLTNTLRSGETVGDLDILDGTPTCLFVVDQLFYPSALLPTSYLPYHTTTPTWRARDTVCSVSSMLPASCILRCYRP